MTNTLPVNEALWKNFQVRVEQSQPATGVKDDALEVKRAKCSEAKTPSTPATTSGGLPKPSVTLYDLIRRPEYSGLVPWFRIMGLGIDGPGNRQQKAPKQTESKDHHQHHPNPTKSTNPQNLQAIHETRLLLMTLAKDATHIKDSKDSKGTNVRALVLAQDREAALEPSTQNQTAWNQCPGCKGAMTFDPWKSIISCTKCSIEREMFATDAALISCDVSYYAHLNSQVKSKAKQAKSTKNSKGKSKAPGTTRKRSTLTMTKDRRLDRLRAELHITVTKDDVARLIADIDLPWRDLVAKQVEFEKTLPQAQASDADSLNKILPSGPFSTEVFYNVLKQNKKRGLYKVLVPLWHGIMSHFEPAWGQETPITLSDTEVNRIIQLFHTMLTEATVAKTSQQSEAATASEAPAATVTTTLTKQKIPYTYWKFLGLQMIGRQDLARLYYPCGKNKTNLSKYFDEFSALCNSVGLGNIQLHPGFLYHRKKRKKG